MQAVSIWNYIWLGTCVRFLQDVGASYAIHGAGKVLNNIELLHRYLDNFGLTVSARAARNALHTIETELRDIEDPDARLTPAQAKTLSESMTTFHATLQAECAGEMAFFVSEKRYSVEKLLHDCRELIGGEVFDLLPELAQHDVNEAGRCLAFELPTAAAFHMLRATEEVLRGFYRSWVRRNRLNEPWLWKAMVDDLNRKTTKPPKALLDNLDNIRRSFRNPTNHPEKVYDLDEAQDLFGLSIEALRRMTLGLRP